MEIESKFYLIPSGKSSIKRVKIGIRFKWMNSMKIPSSMAGNFYQKS
jgi:hypothetical protein